MRIAMFTNNYKPYVGGVPVSIEHLAMALRKRGHSVYIFAPSYREQEEEAYVIRYPSLPLKVAGAPVPNIITKLFLEKILELQIDIIHVHHPALVGNVALSIRRKTRIPVVFTYHTRYEEYLHYIKPLVKLEEHTGFIDGYLKRFCNHCDAIVAPTPGICSYLCGKEIHTPVRIMPTGLPPASYLPEQRRVEEIRKSYKQDADYLFCSVSRLAKEKNLEFQLEGLQCLKKSLNEKGKTFRHLLIGEGPERETLRIKIRQLGLEKEVILTGKIANLEIKNYQAAAELFLFTSRSETQGIVLLEAMAVGNPVVAVDGTGVRDIIEHGKNGFLTREDKKEWAGRITELLENDLLRLGMGREAEKTAYQYSEKAIACQAESYYSSICTRCAAARVKIPVRRKYVV